MLEYHFNGCIDNDTSDGDKNQANGMWSFESTTCLTVQWHKVSIQKSMEAHAYTIPIK